MGSGMRSARGSGAGAVLAELVALYGVVLVVVGLLDDDGAGVGGDLWAGLAMIAVATAFAVRSLIRRSRGRSPGGSQDGGVGT